ncbi:HTH-type transcriptional regulator DmlR [Acetobacteraceae bacterium EV16G]|uniref:HTH-type transcriptional regulator DmlR n=1 Tax=Sorlinia euscelidii TaxID=3081148 RepID=A0ABU7U678_9PROT
MRVDWDKLRIFYAVVEAGSFTHAGEKLGLSQSTVSRQISSLEDDLRVQLFNRRARGLILTEQGETLAATVREVFEKLITTQESLRDSTAKATGVIKLTTTSEFGLYWLIPRLERFFVQQPEIDIQVLLDDTDLDLNQREADVAIRVHPPRQPDLIQRHLATFSIPVYASQDYLADRRIPRHFRDLAQHQVISFSGDPLMLPHANWLRKALCKRQHMPSRSHLEVNSYPAMAEAISEGLGVGAMPSYVAASYPHLVRLVPDHPVPALELYLVYPQNLKASMRLIMLRNFLLNEISLGNIGGTDACNISMIAKSTSRTTLEI